MSSSHCKGILPVNTAFTSADLAPVRISSRLVRSPSTVGNYDMETKVGEVVQNPANPKLWGMKNLSGDNWTYIKADGTQVPVPPGRSAAIAVDTKIDFGQMTGEFHGGA